MESAVRFRNPTLFCLLLSLPLCLGGYASSVAVADDQPKPHDRLTVSGTPSEIGAAIAAEHGDDIEKLHPTFIAVAMALCGQDKDTLYARSAKIAEHMHEDDLATIRAIAAGCDLTYEDVLFLNAFYTLTTRHTMACRQLVVWGDRTEDGRLIHARNLDWIDYPGSPLNDHHLILNVEPKDGHRYVLLTWPGLVGAVTGTNEKQLTVAFNQLLGGDHVDRLAEPAFFVMRRILQHCGTVDEAVKLLTDAKPLDDGSIMVSDAKDNSAAVIEIIDGQVGVRRAEDEMIANANHATREAGIEKPWRVHVGSADWPAGFIAKRIGRKIDPAVAQNIMAHPRVCQFSINIMSAVFDPKNNRMTLSTAKRNAASGPFTTYTLFDDQETTDAISAAPAGE